MVFTDTELLFLRLLDRTKKLGKEDMTANVWKLASASQLLENFYSKMQDEKGIDSDVLMQYGREVHQLKMVVEAQQKKSGEEKLAVLDRIPHGFPDIAPFDAAAVGEQQELPSSSSAREDVVSSSSSGIRARSRAFYQADMRKQLLGEQKRHEEALTAERQDDMAMELLRLTRSLKTNLKATGDVIKDDNKRLTKMQEELDKNTEKLAAEGERLARHAYSCGFDCFLMLLAFLVFWSFIAMVLFVKVFRKPYTY